MAYTTIQRSIHQEMGFQPTDNYRFAAHLSTVPVLSAEIERVAQNMCLAFRPCNRGQGELQLELVAVQSLTPDDNLFVLPDGRWAYGYKPVFYRTHPFAFLKNPNSGELELSIDEGALVAEADADTALPLFDEKGAMSAPARQFVNVLSQTLHLRAHTLDLCQQLLDAGIMEPWPIRYRATDSDGNEHDLALNGLYHVDPYALPKLDGDTLQRLNASGALKLAYAQSMSEQRIQALTHLVEARKKLSPGAATPELDFEQVFGEDDLFSF
jgi:hypothetical protein